jgi:hypothetical protein
MTNFFGWEDKTDMILGIASVTFVVSLLILIILVLRGGRSADAAATIREVRKVGSQVEGMRRQNTNEHGPMQDYVVWTYKQARRICERLGFLDDKNMPEPPLPPAVKPKNDDIN